MSFQKWLIDPISGKEHFATTWSTQFEDYPSRDAELALIEDLVGIFLDDFYLEVNGEACDENSGLTSWGQWRR